MDKSVHNQETLENYIGFYGGTFNPFHKGHLKLIEYLLYNTKIYQIILAPSFSPSHKKNENLISFTHRFEMTRLGVKHLLHNSRIILSDIEKDLSTPSYTYQTLQNLRVQLKHNKIVIILGNDMYQTVNFWYKSKNLLDEFGLVVINRTPLEHPPKTKNNNSQYLKHITYTSNPLWHYASTKIRKDIKEYSLSRNKKLLQQIKEELPKNIFNYIFTHKLYL